LDGSETMGVGGIPSDATGADEPFFDFLRNGFKRWKRGALFDLELELSANIGAGRSASISRAIGLVAGADATGRMSCAGFTLISSGNRVTSTAGDLVGGADGFTTFATVAVLAVLVGGCKVGGTGVRVETFFCVAISEELVVACQGVGFVTVCTVRAG